MKSTSFEKELRVSEIAKQLMRGNTIRAGLLQYVAEMTDWGVCERTVDGYIKDARDMLKNELIQDLEFEKGLALNQLNYLIDKNLKIQDYREVRNCIKAKSEILGLLASKTSDSGLKSKKKRKLNVPLRQVR